MNMCAMENDAKALKFQRFKKLRNYNNLLGQNPYRYYNYEHFDL